MTTSKNIGSSESRRLLFGMSKPQIALIATTVVATTGGAAWLFSSWLDIPGLEAQISALEQQVLELSHENDRYAQLNSQLNQTTMQYQYLNTQLNESTTELSMLNDQFDHSNAVFSELNAQLHEQNLMYASLNAELNETKEELSSINEDLMTIVTFLNDTSTSIQHNVEALVQYLADQIVINQMLLVETLRNTYQQRIQSWDCAYRDYFLTEDFIQNSTLPIGDMLPEVMAYVDQRLLADLCLDPADLELYLASTMNNLDKLTSNELIQGTSRYSALAMAYYFPEASTDAGIEMDDWAAASYRCSNLENPFLWG